MSGTPHANPFYVEYVTHTNEPTEKNARYVYLLLHSDIFGATAINFQTILRM